MKHDPDQLLRLLGTAQAEPLIHAVDQSADLVFDLIERYRMACEPVRKGWLQVAHSPGAVQALHARAEQWARRGVRVEVLDRAAVARRVGSQAFAGGWIDPRAGSLQPLSYTRGLARAAIGLGAQVHGDTLATGLQRQGARWRVATSTGATITADRVVIATNGYTGSLWPQLRQTVISANSFIVATQPLSGAQGDAILGGGETCSTAQRLLLYFRRDTQGRLVMGGRGHFADPSGPQDFRHLERALALLFPQLGPLHYDYRWAGRIAITRDFMPHVHEPAPGITIALGYNGRGIAMATAMGKHLAARLGGAPDSDFPFPISRIKPIPFHGLQRLYIAAGVTWYSLLDKLG